MQHTPAVAGLRMPGRRSSCLAVGTPLPTPYCARWGGREVGSLAAGPGRGRSAHVGAEEVGM